jgi:hypothetical protein
MPASPLKHNGRTLRLQKCAISPDLDSKTILVEDQWDYVKMWLRRNDQENALFFWRQAEEFYQASRDLPDTSSPLTRYYCAMNATKTLIIVKGRPLNPFHGVTGSTQPGKVSLSRETVRIKGSGALSELCRYMGEPVNNESYNLKNLLYNLPYIHRAYTITFRSQPELFVPISKPIFVRIDGSSQSYFRCVIGESQYRHHATLATLAGYEHDVGVQDEFVVRRTNRFAWRDADPIQANVNRFMNYYRAIRRTTYYIRGISRLWYIKKTGPQLDRINRSSLTLTYMALHRLSELARYSPDALSRHFDSQHNWLLSEFINLALDQFLDEISAEITGHEFMPPGVSSR